jgi:carbonic anhydrase/acetyltransferase-like protein (isoleucine patch superfamily)
MSTVLNARARAALERVNEELVMWRRQPVRRAQLRAWALRPYRRRQFASFGDYSMIHRPLWLYGTHKIAIGTGVMFMPGAWLAAERPTWDDLDPAITIGGGSAFRAWVTISASARITIGTNVVFGAGCSVVDGAHTWRSGDPNVLRNPLDSEPIKIGDGSWLGDRVTVLKGAVIGERCAIGAHSVVRGEIPDGSVAVGAPARVVGRSEDL